ncbi:MULTISPECIES: DNA polymerase III subunit delta [unclassified Sphingomonas]|uniref:DNA polymerase III subunit delta n=1 Tax=unclassified Sphingomonas TaxID=196159 RepID=UPI0022699655
MKANASQIRSALDRPRAEIRLYLLHGPDDAGAADLAARLSKAMGAGAERIDLDGPTLRADPARLADEAAALSLFGDARFVRVTPVGEEAFDAFAALLTAERAGNPVVAIAPAIKASGKLVKLAIDSPYALAFACYAPSAMEAEQIVVALAREHGLRIASGTAHKIAEASGGDRAIIAREVEKFALYLDAAPDRPADLDDAAFDAVGADLGDSEATRAVDALIDGRAADLGHELVLLGDATTSPIPWLRQIGRRLIVLAEMRAAIDRGENADAVMKRHRVFYKEEASTARVLRRWSAPLLARALARVREAERAVMAPGNAGTVLAESVIVEIAHAMGKRG